MKKLLSLLVSLTIICSLSTASCASDIAPVMSDSRGTVLEPLKDKGFPEDFLARRTDLQLEVLYNRCKDKDILYGGSKICYMENEHRINLDPLGTIPSYDMVLEISPIYDIDNDRYGNNTYEACNVYVWYEWTSGHPAVKKTDAIAVNWDPSVWTYANEFQHVDYSNEWTEYFRQDRASNANQGGLGYYAYLNVYGSKLIGSTVFKLRPASSPMYPAGSIDPHKTSQISVNYVHDANPLLVQGVSLSNSTFGVSIDFGLFADEASDTFTTFYKFNP